MYALFRHSLSPSIGNRSWLSLDGVDGAIDSENRLSQSQRVGTSVFIDPVQDESPYDWWAIENFGYGSATEKSFLMMASGSAGFGRLFACFRFCTFWFFLLSSWESLCLICFKTQTFSILKTLVDTAQHTTSTLHCLGHCNPVLFLEIPCSCCEDIWNGLRVATSQQFGLPWCCATFVVPGERWLKLKTIEISL